MAFWQWSVVLWTALGWAGVVAPVVLAVRRAGPLSRGVADADDFVRIAARRYAAQEREFALGRLSPLRPRSV